MADNPSSRPLIYLASSWRNAHYATVLKKLRGAGLAVYDFREEGAAFDWSDVDPTWENKPGIRKEYSPAALAAMLNHPRAEVGYRNDFDALLASTLTILVAPCGRSAHLELGHSIGRRIPTGIYLPEAHEPELMYRMATCIHSDLDELVGWASFLQRSL